MDSPGTHPHSSPYAAAAYQPATKVKKAATAKAMRILSLRASLIESVIFGSCGSGLVFSPKLLSSKILILIITILFCDRGPSCLRSLQSNNVKRKEWLTSASVARALRIPCVNPHLWSNSKLLEPLPRFSDDDGFRFWSANKSLQSWAYDSYTRLFGMSLKMCETVILVLSRRDLVRSLFPSDVICERNFFFQIISTL